MNEGFASYAEALWRDHADTDFEYDQWVRETLLIGPGLEERVQAHPVNDLFGIQIYQRGALALHALRLEIGDEVFFEVLQTWVQRYGGENATTADFEALAEELSGQELTPLLDEWIRTEELPTTLGDIDLRAETDNSFVTLADVREAIGEYAACVTDGGATFDGDPAVDQPTDLVAEVERLEAENNEAHVDCSDRLASLGL